MLIKKHEILEKKIDQEIEIAKKSGSKNKRGTVLKETIHHANIHTNRDRKRLKKRSREKEMEEVENWSKQFVSTLQS